MKIEFDDLDKQAKGKIGELVARSYYQTKKESCVFNLEPVKDFDRFNIPNFYSGTGKKYINSSYVLTPREASWIGSNRIFDMLIINNRFRLKFLKDKIDILNKKYNSISNKWIQNRRTIKVKTLGLYYELKFFQKKLLLKEKPMRFTTLKEIMDNNNQKDFYNLDYTYLNNCEMPIPHYLDQFHPEAIPFLKVRYEHLKEIYNNYEREFKEILNNENIQRKLTDVKFFVKRTTWSPCKERSEAYTKNLEIAKQQGFISVRTYIILDQGHLDIKEVKVI